MTAPAEPTIAHGGTRRGDVLQISSSEMHRCHRLIDLEHRVEALAAAAELSHSPVVSLTALRGAIAGAP